MDRREFLRVSGLTGSALLLAGCEDHVSDLQAYVDRPPELVPGEGTFFATACDLCSAGCGAMVRVVEGRAVKLEGLPDHPVSHGGLCALGQASVQHLYHPDRFVAADARDARGNASAAYTALTKIYERAYKASRRPTTYGENITSGIFSYQAPRPEEAVKAWEEASVAAKALWAAGTTKLADGLRGNGGATAILVGDQVRGHRYALINKFATSIGAPPPVIVEPFGHEAVRAANTATYGRPESPHYDIANAGLVILFGEDLFTTGPAPAHYNWHFGQFRRGRDHLRGQLVVVSTRLGDAGAVADLWIGVKPGTHGAIAQALIGDPAKGGIAPAIAASLTGAPIKKIEELLHKFHQARPAIAIGGGEVLGHTNAVSALAAINAVNVAAGSVGIKGGVLAAAPAPIAGMAPPPPTAYRDLHALADKMRNGQIKALLLVGIDPFTAFPGSAKLGEALKAVPFIASFSTVPDDGCGVADVVLPDSTFIERWGDSTPSVGTGASVATLMQPGINPVFATMPVEDTLIAVAKALGKDLGVADSAAYYKQMWAKVAPDAGAPGTVSPWKQALRAGGISKPAAGPLTAKSAMLPAPEAPSFPGGDSRPFHLLPIRSIKYRDGRGSHLPWLQEIADPMSAAAWGGWLEINPKTAEKLGLHQYDEVMVESDHGAIVVGVVPYPGIPEDVVAIPLNYSKQKGTRYDSVLGGNVYEATLKTDPGRGEDARALLADVIEQRGGGLAWGATMVSLKATGKKSKLVMVSKQVPPQESPAAPPKVHQEFKVWPIG